MQQQEHLKGNHIPGGRCIKVWLKTQAVITKRLAESEFCGVV